MASSRMGSASRGIAAAVVAVFVMFAMAMVEGQAPAPAPASTGYGLAPGPAPASHLRGYPVGAPAYSPASSSGAPAAYAPAAPFMVLGVTCLIVSLTLFRHAC